MEYGSSEDLTDVPTATWQVASGTGAGAPGIYVWAVQGDFATGETLQVETQLTTPAGTYVVEAEAATPGDGLTDAGAQTVPLVVHTDWLGQVRVRHDAAGPKTISVVLFKL